MSSASNPGSARLPPAVYYQVDEVVAERYRIEAVIGRGGAGTVYRALALDLNQTIALKVMHDRDVGDVDLERFEREARAAKKLRHHNAVQVIDMGYIDSVRPYIIYELLEGQTLRRAIRQEGAFEGLRAARISYGISDALVCAHDAGIVHRDLKPANIFLTTSADHGEVSKVLDLGLSTAPNDEDSACLTLTGDRLGTPRYMSPEMARGQHVGPESDLYSLALIMAEMVSGVAVLQQKMQIDLLMAHASDDPHPLRADVLDSPLCSVIQRALAKDLSVRYRTALQMRADIEAVIRQLEEDDGDTVGATADLAPTMMMDVSALHEQARAAGYSPPSSDRPTTPASSGSLDPTPASGGSLEPTPASDGAVSLPQPQLSPLSAAEVVGPSAYQPTPPSRSTKSSPPLWLMVLLLLLLAAAAGATGYFLG